MSDERILLITKGHPFERDAFFGLFDALDGVEWTHVEQPAAQVFFDPALARDYDAFVLYDMPGIDFRPGGPEFSAPGETFARNFCALLDDGFGFVFLHHAIAGWPAWETYAETLGGRFLYVPGELRGTPRPDSGYRHQVEHRVRVLREHPVTAGVPAEFEMTDELYLFEVFEDVVEPLLASDYAFVRDNFYSAARVVQEGKMFDNEGWEHPPGSNLVGWIRPHPASRIVYLQGGDDPVAYANPNYRTLLRNAIRWAAGHA